MMFVERSVSYPLPDELTFLSITGSAVKDDCFFKVARKLGVLNRHFDSPVDCLVIFLISGKSALLISGK